jgi:hypothetical protein
MPSIQALRDYADVSEPAAIEKLVSFVTPATRRRHGSKS